MRDDREEILGRMTLDELAIYQRIGGDVPRRLFERAAATEIDWRDCDGRDIIATRHGVDLADLRELGTREKRVEFFRRYVPPN
jgi:hypothetical protein